jgi:hypothetical protein
VKKKSSLIETAPPPPPKAPLLPLAARPPPPPAPIQITMLSADISAGMLQEPEPVRRMTFVMCAPMSERL